MAEGPGQEHEQQELQGLAQQRGIEGQGQARGRHRQRGQDELGQERPARPETQPARQRMDQEDAHGGAEHAQDLDGRGRAQQRGQGQGQEMEHGAVGKGQPLPAHLARPGPRRLLVGPRVGQERRLAA